MISEFSSDIVIETHRANTPAGEPVELLVFRNRLTLAVSAGALAVYRSPEFFGDPLGNGLVDSVDLPVGGELIEKEGRLVAGIQSGCVNLMDDKVLLILPNEVRLYPDGEAALRNRAPLVSLPLANN